MGEARSRNDRFLREHPLCCFCDGRTAATTIDHQPARALFDRRDWPEGYAFPACHECNQSSKHYEHIMALLVRINHNEDVDPVRTEETKKLLRAMSNNFPGLLKPLSANEKRQFFKQEGMKRPAALSELHMVGLASGDTQNAVDTVLGKLFRALHYKHVRQIAPPDGVVFLRWFTNAYGHAARELTGFIDALPGKPNIRRNNRDCSDQFNYRYGVDFPSDFSAYCCLFRNSLLAVAMVASDRERWDAEIAHTQAANSST